MGSGTTTRTSSSGLGNASNDESRERTNLPPNTYTENTPIVPFNKPALPDLPMDLLLNLTSNLHLDQLLRLASSNKNFSALVSEPFDVSLVGTDRSRAWWRRAFDRLSSLERRWQGNPASRGVRLDIQGCCLSEPELLPLMMQWVSRHCTHLSLREVTALSSKGLVQLLQHAKRLESLSLCHLFGLNTFTEPLLTLRESHPQLHTLAISHVAIPMDQLMLHPGLQAVALTNCEVILEGSLPESDVRVLMLGGSTFTPAYSPEHYQKIVAACPRLRLLEHTSVRGFKTPDPSLGRVALLDLCSSVSLIEQSFNQLTASELELAQGVLPSAVLCSCPAQRTALHYATAAQDVDMVRLLCEARCDPNKKDKRGYTPLMVMAVGALDGSDGTADCADIVQTLLRSGAQMDIMNHKREAPLWVAALRGQEDVVAALIQAGAHLLQCEDHDGWNPLHAACIRGSEVVALQLLRAGMDVHAKNKHGQQPVHIASRSRSIPLMQMLLEADADPNARDGCGKGPLEYAARSEMRELLEQVGATAANTSKSKKGNRRRRK